MRGFENIGVVAFTKELEFHQEFRFRITARLGGFLVTVVLAILWRDYWALAWGAVAGSLITVLLSYRAHPFRPRWSLARFHDIWWFSQWRLIQNIGTFVRGRTDRLVVGRFFDPTGMGIYSVAHQIASLPGEAVFWPLTRVLFPSYTKIAAEPERLGRAYLTVLGVLALVMLPASVGLALVCEPLILILLGETWMPVAGIFVWLVLFLAIVNLSSSVQPVLMAMGEMRKVAALVWAQGLFTLPFVIAAGVHGSITMVALAQLGTSLVTASFSFFALTSTHLVSWQQIAAELWRPLTATAIMSGAVVATGEWSAVSPFFELAGKAGVGAAVFCAALYGLWRLGGKSGGAEMALVHVLRRLPKSARAAPTASDRSE